MSAGLYLVGDEDGGVWLYCRECGSDTDAIAYYSGFCQYDPGPDVPSVDSIPRLAEAAALHAASHEPDAS